MKKPGFLKRIPLSVKTACFMLLVVTATVALVQWFESRRLKDIFVKFQLEMHEKSAQEQLYRFVDLLREQRNMVKALVTQKNFIEHLERHEKNGWTGKNKIEMDFYDSSPEWFPSKSVTMAFYHNAYALLIDPRGRVREVYQDIEKPLSPRLFHPELILPRLVNTDGVITYIGNDPFQIVIQRVYNPARQVRATVMFVFPIDTHFIRKSQGAILGDNELAFLDQDNRVMASSNADLIPKGMANDQLSKKYYISKKTFFSYGEAEIEMMFVSLMPKATIELLTRKALNVEIEHGLIYGVAFILSSTLAVLLLSRRIKNLTEETVRFIRHHFGIQHWALPGGDEMTTLETSFHQMKERIVSYQDHLAAEKERLAVTLGSIGDAVIATDTEGSVVLLNKVAEDLTGWPPEEAIGRPLTDVFHIINEKTRKRCENPIDKILRTGMVMGLAKHTVLIARDGTERVIADSGAPILDRENRLIGMVLVFRDITEHKTAETKLLFLKEAIESLQIGITLCNMQGRIVYTNAAEAAMHGYSVDELLNLDARIFAPPGLWRALSFEQVNSMHMWVRESVNIRQNGEPFPVQLTSIAVRDSGGAPLGVITTCEDITRRKRHEEERLKLNKLESISVLAAGVAHEINTPLTNALLKLQIVKDNLLAGAGTDEVAPKIEVIEGNIERASLIAKELLQFSSRRVYEFVPLNVNDVISAALLLTGHRMKNIVVNQDLTEVPDTAGDAVRLEQVFVNILNNSIDAMPGGGSIGITTRYGDNAIEACISDTGIGIPEQNLQKTFDPFFTTKEIGAGTGLGLSICYGIITQHGGSIEIKSQAGKGTSVIIRLPVKTNL